MSQRCQIVIPAKKVDYLCVNALQQIRKHYPHVTVFLIVDELSESLPFDERVEQVVSPQRSIAYKRNLGVELCKAEIVAFLDSDAYPHMGWIEAALQVFDTYPEAAIVGGPNLYYEIGHSANYYSYMAESSWLLSTGYSYAKATKVREVEHVPSCNMFVRREVYNSLQGMRTHIVTGEDVEFCIRAAKAGYKVIHAPMVKASHKTRCFTGFIKQRFVWGRATFTVLKHTFPHYVISILPVVAIAGVLLLLCAAIWHAVARYVLLAMFALYTIIVVAEAIRLSRNVRQIVGVLPYLYCSIVVLGIGGVYSLIAGDKESAYRYYNNTD